MASERGPERNSCITRTASIIEGCQKLVSVQQLTWGLSRSPVVHCQEVCGHLSPFGVTDVLPAHTQSRHGNSSNSRGGGQQPGQMMARVVGTRPKQTPATLVITPRAQRLARKSLWQSALRQETAFASTACHSTEHAHLLLKHPFQSWSHQPSGMSYNTASGGPVLLYRSSSLNRQPLKMSV